MNVFSMKEVKKNKYMTLYWNKAPIDATILGVQINNSTTDLIFCRTAMKLLAKGKPVRELKVKGSEIGSHVLGGAQEYYLFYC